jgi:hypothetical protein
MTRGSNYDLDLAFSRIIKASRQLVWSAWADPTTCCGREPTVSPHLGISRTVPLALLDASRQRQV